jgi:ABC-2 type transport system permease protein
MSREGREVSEEENPVCFIGLRCLRATFFPFLANGTINLNVAAMRKYWHVINTGIQNMMVYRVNFLFRAGFGLIPLIATILLWRTIYEWKEAGADVGGYTLAGMISYYLMITIVDAFSAVNEEDWQIAADIKDGNISQFLLKPIDYLTYRFCLFISGRFIYILVALIPTGLFIFFLREYFLPPANLKTLALFFVSLFMTALLQFFMSYTMALLAFWVLEVSTFIFIMFAFEYIAGGHLFPLNILPPTLAAALNFTPFPYLLYFPISIYLGQTTGDELARGLLVQAVWTIAFYGLARFVWSKGIRKYSAVGG